jgi:hypothetical protein
MVPGRAPEPEVLPRLLIGIALVGLACWFRRKQFRWAAFALPFAAAACFMLVQNVVTNRQVQAYHMVNCLMPLLAFVVPGSLQAFKPRGTWPNAAMVCLIIVATTAQILGYKEWSRNIETHPAQYALDSAFPRTLDWLNHDTAARSVVVFPETMATAAPLFTRNGAYLGYYVYQYVVPSHELKLRSEARDNWYPGRSFPYRADYVLAQGARCRQWASSATAFHDLGEDTCIFRLGP